MGFFQFCWVVLENDFDDFCKSVVKDAFDDIEGNILSWITQEPLSDLYNSEQRLTKAQILRGLLILNQVRKFTLQALSVG